MPVLHRDGADVFYDVCGEGPTVLFLHNILCNRHVFDGAIDRLQGQFRCVRMDVRGHGDSAPPLRPYDVADLVGDALAVLDAVAAPSAAIVGLSLGATVAMELTLGHPGRAQRLVLMGGSVGVDPWITRLKNSALANLVRLVGPRRLLLSQATPLLFGTTFRRESPDQVKAWEDAMMRLSALGLYSSVRVWSRRRSLQAAVAAIACPTLVVVGDEDVSCPPAFSEAIRAAIPGARLESIARGGHALTVERPMETADVLHRFLSLPS